MPSNQTQQPFLFREGKPQATRLLPPNGKAGYASSINERGQIIGQFSDGSNIGSRDAYPRAFLYDSANGNVAFDLSRLSPKQETVAMGINNRGQVVGTMTVAPNKTHAFLYSDGRLQDLNALLSEDNDWRFTEATGINDAGQIVGQAVNRDGLTHGFLLTPR